MTAAEFTTIAKALKAVYADPKFMADDEAMEVWYRLLADLDYKTVNLACQEYMQTVSFAPKPSDIRAYATKQITPLTDDMSELEAWGILKKAIGNGIYGSQEEFDKLPEIIQKTIGRPERIKELARLDIDELETVEQSHFVRNYRAQMEQKRQNMQLQPMLHAQIEATRASHTPAIDMSDRAIEDKQPRIEAQSSGISDIVQAELDSLRSKMKGEIT